MERFLGSKELYLELHNPREMEEVEHFNQYIHNSKEALTYGNLSTLCKKKFLYRMGPVLRASLWPDQWSYSVPLGIKRKIWTLPFHWYPLVSCGFSGLDTTASQCQAFFPKVESAENWPTLLSGETQLFGNFFQMAAIPREIWILTWNQSQMKLKHQIFMERKKLVDLSNQVSLGPRVLD